MRYPVVILSLTFMLVFFAPLLVCAADSASGAETRLPQPQDILDNPDSTAYYAFLRNVAPAPRSNVLNWLTDRGLVLRLDGLSERPAFRPFARWVTWANSAQKFAPALLFVFFVALAIWQLAPQALNAVEAECTKAYWRCQVTGLLLVAISIVFLRGVLLTGLLYPLGIVLIGAFQLAMLVGLSAVVSLIGRSAGYYLHLSKLSAMRQYQWLRRTIELFIGAFAVALLLQIGSIGLLPPLGTRLVALLAVVGLGAIYSTRSRL